MEGTNCLENRWIGLPSMQIGEFICNLPNKFIIIWEYGTKVLICYAERGSIAGERNGNTSVPCFFVTGREG